MPHSSALPVPFKSDKFWEGFHLNATLSHTIPNKMNKVFNRAWIAWWILPYGFK